LYDEGVFRLREDDEDESCVDSYELFVARDWLLVARALGCCKREVEGFGVEDQVVSAASE